MRGAEQSTLDAPEIEFHRSEYERLVILLELEAGRCKLPEEPSCRDELNDLLIRVRIRR